MFLFLMIHYATAFVLTMWVFATLNKRDGELLGGAVGLKVVSFRSRMESV